MRYFKVLWCLKDGPLQRDSRRIYTTFILGTALLYFGLRANNMGHGLLDFCRVKANFSARVPKNLGGPRPPHEAVLARLKRGPLVATGEIFVPRVFFLVTDNEGEGSGIKSTLLGRGKKDMASTKSWKNFLLEQRCHRDVN